MYNNISDIVSCRSYLFYFLFLAFRTNKANKETVVVLLETYLKVQLSDKAIY